MCGGGGGGGDDRRLGLSVDWKNTGSDQFVMIGMIGRECMGVGRRRKETNFLSREEYYVSNARRCITVRQVTVVYVRRVREVG